MPALPEGYVWRVADTADGVKILIIKSGLSSYVDSQTPFSMDNPPLDMEDVLLTRAQWMALALNRRLEAHERLAAFKAKYSV